MQDEILSANLKFQSLIDSINVEPEFADGWLSVWNAPPNIHGFAIGGCLSLSSHFATSGFNDQGLIVAALDGGHEQSHRDHEMAVGEEHSDDMLLSFN